MDIKYIRKAVNEIGKNCPYHLDNFVFKKIIGRDEKSHIWVLVQNKYSKDIKKVNFNYLKQKKTLPFNYRIYYPEKIIRLKVNSMGLKSKNKYKRFKFYKLINKKTKKIIVENLYSKEKKLSSLPKILSGRNPFFKRNLKSWIGEIKETVNLLGKKWDNYESFYFIKVVSKTHRDDFIVKIKNKSSGVTKESLYYSLKVGRNPFRSEVWLNPVFIKKEVNRLGSLGSKEENFKFIKFIKRETNHRPILIESIVSKDRVISSFDSLQSGVNPFRCIFDFDEKLNVHPMVFKILKKQRIKILSYEKILIMGRPDFICSTKSGKVFIIETKSDKKKWSKVELNKQISRYDKEGLIKYNQNFIKSYIVSPNGKYGLSFRDLNRKLKLDVSFK